MTNLTAAPGIYLVIPTEEKSPINLGKSSDKKLLKGKIFSVGSDRDHDSGGKMVATYEEGDVVYFLNYEAAYDNFEERINDKLTKIYCVLFHDVRAKVE